MMWFELKLILLFNSLSFVLTSMTISLFARSNHLKDTLMLNQIVNGFLKNQTCIEILLSHEFNLEISALLLKLFNKNMPVLVKSIDCGMKHECTNHLFLISNSSSSFSYDFKGHGLANRNQTLLFVVNHYQSRSIKELKEQFGNARVAIYDDRDAVYALDSPALKERHFYRVSTDNGRAQTVWDNIESKVYVKGGVIRVATFECPLFSMTNNKTGQVEGIEAEVVKEMARQLNITLLFVPLVQSNYSKFGFKLDNGTWVGGVMGALYSRTADLGFCALWVSSDRVYDVELTMPWGRVDLTFLVPRPKQRKEHWHTIFLPFHLHTWVAILVTFVLVSLSDWLLLETSHTMFKKRREDLSAVLLGMFGVFTQCSSMISRGRHSPLVFCWYVLCVILVALYSSNIVSRLTLPLYTERINTVRHLVQQGFIWGRPFTSNTANLLNLQDYWHRKFRAEHFRMLKPEEIHNLIMSGRFALSVQVLEKYYVFSSDFYNLQDSELMNLRVMEDFTNQYMVSIQMLKGSPFYPACNLQIQWLLAVGLVDHWKRDVVRRHNRSLMLRLMIDMDQSLSEPTPLAFDSFQGAFLVLCVGHFSAFIVFLYEVHVLDLSSYINKMFHG